MYLVSGYQPQRRPETAPSRNTEPKILTCRYKSQNYFNASACTVCMYVCMYAYVCMYVCMYCMHVCFCHLHWCALATTSHSCRLWGPTTSLTHPLHTHIPYIYKDKFHKCKRLLLNVCMYVCISPPAVVTRCSEGKKTASFTDPAAQSRTRARRTVLLITVK